jgi:hypothetical protein
MPGKPQKQGCSDRWAKVNKQMTIMLGQSAQGLENLYIASTIAELEDKKS